MASISMPDGVTTILERDTVSATGVIDASPSVVFDFIRRPANHAEISGDHSVRGTVKGPELLGPDSRFGMKMKVGVPYRMRSRVVEFGENRVLAWCHFSGHRWRWELQPTGDGQTQLTETFDLSTAKIPFMLRRMGYPKGHLSNVANSIANVAGHFAKS
ncbi:MAG: SRPBCC family protein [Actinomycetota bacterium]|nr:SRPBCC family protein [Actinomycetota bacterium]